MTNYYGTDHKPIDTPGWCAVCDGPREQCGHTHGTPPPAPDHLDPDIFFTRDGLQVSTLADVIKARVTHGRGEDGRLWIHHSGVWQPDVEDRVSSAIAETLGQRYRRSHLTNVLDLLKFDLTSPRIKALPVQDRINVTNGLLDWSAGELHPHDPAALSTVQLPIKWTTEADCPAFKEFIAEVLPEDCITPTDESPGFIWELLGYIAMSGNPLHIAVLLFGSGRNGKGTLLRAILAMLGEQNVSSVALHDLMNNRFRVATLFGKVANIAGDLDSKWLDSTALFKAITGGDLVQGEHKYGATWDFTPWAVPIFSANKAFGSPDSSEGYFSRWVVVPFPNTFTGKEDRDLTNRITTTREVEGILNHAVAALPTLMTRGRLPEPPSVADAKHAFIVASDPVRAWLAERGELGDGFTLRTDIAHDYKSWCDANDVKTISTRELYARLDTVSTLRATKIGGYRGYRGLILKVGEHE